MTSKPDQSSSKGSTTRPVRKSAKGAVETTHLFIDVTDLARRTQLLPLSRYVE